MQRRRAQSFRSSRSSGVPSILYFCHLPVWGSMPRGPCVQWHALTTLQRHVFKYRMAESCLQCLSVFQSFRRLSLMVTARSLGGLFDVDCPEFGEGSRSPARASETQQTSLDVGSHSAPAKHHLLQHNKAIMAAPAPSIDAPRAGPSKLSHRKASRQAAPQAKGASGRKTSKRPPVGRLLGSSGECVTIRQQQ